MKTSKEALATFLGWDIADMKDALYQPGRWTTAVYSVGATDYYCAVRNAVQLPKPTRRDANEITWVEVTDTYINSKGWKIFKNQDK